MLNLLALFVILPIVELLLLIEIGQRIGTPATLLLILATGVIGASLARLQGLSVLRRMREESSMGRPPTDALIDGLLILVAGAVLITPGVLTDVFGFLCLFPPSRRVIKALVVARFRKAVKDQTIRYSVHFGDEPPVRDVEAEVIDEREGIETENEKTGNEK